MSDERKTMRKPETKSPQGVSGEAINIVGTLTKTVRVGGQAVRNHKFFVVKNCVVKYLAGIDFIFRLGRATWEVYETGDNVLTRNWNKPGKNLRCICSGRYYCRAR